MEFRGFVITRLQVIQEEIMNQSLKHQSTKHFKFEAEGREFAKILRLLYVIHNM